MSFLKKIGSFFKSRKDDRNYWFYVKCDHCGEVLKGRVDMFSDLSIQYGEGRKGSSYYCRKVLIGSNRCYRRIEAEFTFNDQRKMTEKAIRGGQFISEDEYTSTRA